MPSDEDVNLETLEAANKLLSPKQKPKAIRVLTVITYVLGVSIAAILLSVYYIFVWEGKPHIGARTSTDFMDFNDFSNSSKLITQKGNETSDTEQIQDAIYISTTKDYAQNLEDLETSNKENNPNGYSQNLQEQIEASEELENLNATYSTQSVLTTEANTIWSDEDLNSADELRGRTLIKKIMEAYPYDGPD